MNTMIEKLAEMLVVPVVVLEDAADAEKLADALVKGGLPQDKLPGTSLL